MPRIDLQEKDRQLREAGIPLCPRCGERDKVIRQVGAWWCERRFGFLAALTPRQGRHTPDF